MNAQDKELIRDIINEQIQQIEQKLPGLEEQTKPISPDNAIGRLSRMEAINERSVNQATYRKAKIRLEGLLAAREKIDDEDYGQCLECGESIHLKRLKILPESALCMDCLNDKNH